jgi:uncharacterized DUF497 family protein
MAFSWDEKKREENWELRKVDFAEAIGIFDDPEIIESIDDRSAYGEERIQALGKTSGVFLSRGLHMARRYPPHYHGMEGRETWQETIRNIIRAATSPR